MTSTRPKLSVLYRGPLASCNYDCGYCPFAKRRSPPEELVADRRALERFVGWAAGPRSTAGDTELHILFTPWGEALVRPWYRSAMTTLSHLPTVRKVACQTNLSGPLDWLDETDRSTVALWTTFHPSEVPYDRFIERCRRLDALRVAYSVGVVGLKSHFEVIERLRADLRPEVYLWINAYKSEGSDYYAPSDRAFLGDIDPNFFLNAERHFSFGQACQTGLTAITVDGVGDVRRCHFVPRVLGNLYRDDLRSLLKARPCPNATCGCHIGYVHLERLGQYAVYGDGLMPRIPARWPEVRA